MRQSVGVGDVAALTLALIEGVGVGRVEALALAHVESAGVGEAAALTLALAEGVSDELSEPRPVDESVALADTQTVRVKEGPVVCEGSADAEGGGVGLAEAQPVCDPLKLADALADADADALALANVDGEAAALVDAERDGEAVAVARPESDAEQLDDNLEELDADVDPPAGEADIAVLALSAGEALAHKLALARTVAVARSDSNADALVEAHVLREKLALALEEREADAIALPLADADARALSDGADGDRVGTAVGDAGEEADSPADGDGSALELGVVVAQALCEGAALLVVLCVGAAVAELQPDAEVLDVVVVLADGEG